MVAKSLYILSTFTSMVKSLLEMLFKKYFTGVVVPYTPMGRGGKCDDKDKGNLLPFLIYWGE